MATAFHVKNNNRADWRGFDACSLCRLISARFSAVTHDRARCSHLIGGGDASDPTAMRSREVAGRAGFAGIEQTAINRDGLL